MTTTAQLIKRRSPEILLGVGIAGFVGAVITAAKATPEAMRRIGTARRQNDGEITTKDKIIVAAPCYIPTVALCAASTTALIFSCSIHNKRNAALTAAYALSEAALKDYKLSVKEVLGDRSNEKVVDNIAKQKIDAVEPKESEEITAGHGTQLCYDTLSGREFWSDIETIRRAVNNLNKQLIDEQFISVNEWYYELGLDPTGEGHSLGWNADHGLIDISFSSQLNKNGIPEIVLMYNVQPNAKYLRP